MSNRTFQWLVGIALLLSGALASTGCQSAINGQNVPSPYYLGDDMSYAPTGPEFKLPQEAAATEG
ncbi:MAG: hypothetical protein MI861_09145 [Pirellulales bacterium]|nr:hypothetical protein [Pirellulales bacterium]